MSLRRVVRARVLFWIAAAVLAASLVWGLTAAFAVTSSPVSSPAASGASGTNAPSPAAGAAAGKVVLHIGWTSEPDNLNPFIGTVELRDLGAQLLVPVRLGRPQPAHARPGERSSRPRPNGGISADGKVWTIHIRPRREVAGRPAAHGGRRGLHLQLRHQERHDATSPTTRSASSRPRRSTRPPCGSSARRPRPTWRARRCRSCPSTSGRTSRRQAAQSSYVVKLPLVGSGPFQVVAFKKGSYVEMVRNPLLVRPQAGHRRDLLRALPGRRHHGHRPEARQLSTPPGACRGAVLGAQVEPRASRRSPTTTTTGTTSSSTATTTPARWATRCCATGGSATP